MSKKQKAVQIIKWGLIGVLSIAVIFILTVLIVHKASLSKEYGKLEKAGYVNKVSVGDYKLNVCTYGNENGKHKIVAMSGMNVNDYSVTIRQVTDAVADENLIAIVDRAGYGLSDDTKKKQTTEQIVEDYRTALKNAGIEPPYVLMPHSLGGVYATYWESVYPDEIEGVFMIDTSQLYEGDVFEDEFEIGIKEHLEVVCCKIGLQRLVYDKIFMPPALGLDSTQKSYVKALNLHHTYTNAKVSEAEYINDNCRTAYENIVKNEIPKVYICASSSFETEEDVREYFEYANDKMTSAGSEPPYKSMLEADTFSEVAQNIVDASKDFYEEITEPYIALLGNCDYVAIPGDHLIYEQKPDEVAKALVEFLERVEEE